MFNGLRKLHLLTGGKLFIFGWTFSFKTKPVNTHSLLKKQVSLNVNTYSPGWYDKQAWKAPLADGTWRFCGLGGPGASVGHLPARGTKWSGLITHTHTQGPHTPPAPWKDRGAGGGREYCCDTRKRHASSQAEQLSLLFRGRTKKEKPWRVPDSSCLSHSSKKKEKRKKEQRHRETWPYPGQDRLLALTNSAGQTVNTGWVTGLTGVQVRHQHAVY